MSEINVPMSEIRLSEKLKKGGAAPGEGSRFHESEV